MTYEQIVELEDLFREANLGYDYINSTGVNNKLFAITLSNDEIDFQDSLLALEDDGQGSFHSGLVMLPSATVLRTGDYNFAKSLIPIIKEFKRNQ